MLKNLISVFFLLTGTPSPISVKRNKSDVRIDWRIVDAANRKVVKAGQAVASTLDAYPEWHIPSKVIAILEPLVFHQASVAPDKFHIRIRGSKRVIPSVRHL